MANTKTMYKLLHSLLYRICKTVRWCVCNLRISACCCVLLHFVLYLLLLYRFFLSHFICFDVMLLILLLFCSYVCRFAVVFEVKNVLILINFYKYIFWFWCCAFEFIMFINLLLFFHLLLCILVSFSNFRFSCLAVECKINSF